MKFPVWLIAVTLLLEMGGDLKAQQAPQGSRASWKQHAKKCVANRSKENHGILILNRSKVDQVLAVR